MDLDRNKRCLVGVEEKNDNSFVFVVVFLGKVKELKCIGFDKVLGK